MRRIIFILQLLIVPLIADESEASEHIMDLTADTIDEVVANHQSTLVLFYAPWCGHCKHLMPEYDLACKEINERHPGQIACARLDCTAHNKVCNDHGLRGYPTVKLMEPSYVCEYKGARSKKDILDWVEMYNMATNDINDAGKIKEAIKGVESAIVAFHEPHHELRKLGKDVVCQTGPLAYFLISCPTVAEELGIEEPNSFSLFKNGEYVKTLEDVSSQEALSNAIFFHVNPLVPEYSHDKANVIFGPNINYYMAYIYSTPESLAKHKPLLESYAESQMLKVRVFTLDASDPSKVDIVSFFHVTSFPSVVFYNDETQNYFHLNQEELSVDHLSNFAEGCLNGSVPFYVKKQAIPDDWDKLPLKVLVYDTFDKMFETYRSGIVVFHAPWCGHCKALMPTLEEFAEYVAATYPDIFVAKFDHTQNELADVEVSGYPTIYAFKSRQEKVLHTGGRGLPELKEFLEKVLIKGEEPTSEEPSAEEPEADKEPEHEDL